ncbi:PP2C family protein-serine/threonine phosphatase [Desulfobacter vibrioformis]|uniref:PP2C family protein-serine/threonine phosphatase n=1 Tax=Desulfobacter vibrioformis TaxID=34031 RepID=UPI0005520C6F|nr:fused response regulator/phosphatase [Desulfobacter vibrioformis]
MADAYSILVVDDNQLNLKLIKKVLTKEGYITLLADNGPDARRIAAQEHPDLILLDIEMPGEDGFEVIKKLKNDAATVTIPVLFLTGMSEVDVKLKGFELGAVDYILKPFHSQEVLARVRIHLKLSIATNSLVQDQARKLRQVSRAQNAMLPKPEDFPDAGFSVFYRPLEEAGGDLYDILNISNQITGYFLADSSGHDIETSYTTASVKALLAQNCTPVYSPRESMKMINDVLVEILPREKYLTACYLHLNRGTRIMTLVNAGHPPVVYMPKGKKPFFIKIQGDILGMFSDASFGMKRIAVNQGDRFFVYSDGMVESKEKKISWVTGLQGLLSMFEGVDKIDLADVPNILISRLFNGDPMPEDDIVLLCIEV